jgi:bifunctional non-homologous end joining protein LigD
MLAPASAARYHPAAMRLPAGFIPPCLPTKAQEPPSGDGWLHEIKHDGFRLLARRGAERVLLLTRKLPNPLPHRTSIRP